MSLNGGDTAPPLFVFLPTGESAMVMLSDSRAVDNSSTSNASICATYLPRSTAGVEGRRQTCEIAPSGEIPCT